MQKISRIYLGNCGYRSGWYDGLTMNLVNPDTAAPDNAILNLENGGGKTSLLSLVFSVFEPRMDRFLKHRQSSNNHFSDYFANDGLLGLVMVEWEMPGRKQGQAPYRLVVGQAVSAVAAQLQPTRVFFAFEASSTLRLEDVPGAKLSGQEALTMPDFKAWLSSTQRKEIDLWHTETQGDWVDHLRLTRGIDVDLLSLQVDFSVKEGGVDDAFLNIKSDQQFFGRFLTMTQDRAQAELVRAVVGETCDKLANRPKYEAMLAELTKLQGTLIAFDERARAYTAQKAEALGFKEDGAHAVIALQRRASQGRHEQVEHRREAEQQAEHLRLAQADETTATAGLLNLQALAHRREEERAAAAHAAALACNDQASSDLQHARAAQVQSAIDSAKLRIQEMESAAQEQAQGLEPFKVAAELAGGRLRQAFDVLITQLQAQLVELEAQDSRQAGQRKDVKDGQAHARAELNRHVQEQSRLEEQGAAYARARGRHVQDGVLLHDEEPEAGSTRHQAQQAKHEAQLMEVEQGLAENAASEAQVQSQLQRVAVERRTLAGAIANDKKFCEEGLAARDRLIRNELVRSVLETDVFEPDSAQVLTRMERFQRADQDQFSCVAVDLSRNKEQREAIGASGVAGANPDVSLTVEVLQLAGIKSAQPFKDYLAKVVPDAAEARALVMSNPGRFLGVTVASAEMDKVRALAWDGRRPFLPVMVSEHQLTADAVSVGAVTVPSFTDAGYNTAAATAVKTQLDQENGELVLKQVGLRQRLDEAGAVIAQLKAFQEKFGNGALAQAQERHAASVARESAQASEQDDLEKRRLALAGARDSLLQKRDSALKASEACARAVSQLLAFSQTAEHIDRGARNARLADLATLHGDIVERIKASEVFLETLERQQKEGVRQRASLEGQLASARREQGKVTFFCNIEEHAQAAESVDALEAAYRSAVDLFRTNEKDRLGALTVKLDLERATLSEKQAELARDYPSSTEEEMLPHLQMAAGYLDTLQVRLNAAQEAKGSSKAHLEQSKRTGDQWRQKNRSAVVTPELAALSDEEADAEQVRMQTLLVQAADRARAAEAARNAAYRAAEDAGRSAQQDDGLVARLTDSMQFRGMVDPEVIRAEAQSMEVTLPLRSAIELDTDANAQVSTLVRAYSEARDGQSKSADLAQRAHRALMSALSRPDLRSNFPALVARLEANDFEASCARSTQLANGLEDNLASVRSDIDEMQPRFEMGLTELYNLTESSVALLASAVKIKVPLTAPYVGGKPVLKLKASFISSSGEAKQARRQAVKEYLDELIKDSRVIPATGADLVACVLMRIANDKPGLSILKMVRNEADQYVAFDRITNSGGEGVMMALFLYTVITQLRAETMASVHKSGGGPLVMDNPFAKATSPKMWEAATLLANAMGVQLIFTTAIQDYNTLGEFPSMIRLRRAGQNSKTGREHLEQIRHVFRGAEEAVI